MTTSLPNDVYSNLIQIPLVFACCILLPVLKCYCVTENRPKQVWRYDVLRNCLCNLTSLAFIIAVAIVFQGNDRLNFYTIVATDLSLGISLDILVHRAMRVGGCEIGNYGDPTSFTRFMWHSAISVCIFITTRCTSAITAVFMFPFANTKFEMGEKYFSDDITIYLVPVLYLTTRTLMLDAYNKYDAGYIRVVHDKRPDFVIEDDNPETTSDSGSP